MVEADLGRGGAARLDGASLCLLYQPQVSLVDGALVGLEAFVRGTCPRRGLVGSAVLLDAAARAPGGPLALDTWVLAEACRALVSPTDGAKPPARVAVNLHPASVGPGLVSAATAALAETGADPRRVCLEVTEAALAQSSGTAGSSAAHRAVHELADLGFVVGVDDFGTGHSSLAVLQRLPLHELKIDVTFVAGLGGAHGYVVSDAVVALAEALGLTTVAEGVERPDQLRILDDLGCDWVQGHLVAPPAPLGEALAAAARWRDRVTETGRSG